MNAPNFGSNISDDDSTIVPQGAVPKYEPAVISAPPKKAMKPNQLANYPNRVWVQLEDNDNIPPTGQFFGHNGTGFILKAGVPAEVPVELLDILNNAEYLAAIIDQQTKQVIGYTPRLRFAYRIVPAPAEELQVA